MHEKSGNIKTALLIFRVCCLIMEQAYRLHLGSGRLLPEIFFSFGGGCSQ